MESQNAFIGEKTQPTADEVAAALGTAAETWNELLKWMSTEHGVSEQEWKSYSPKFGWSMKLKLKKRTILHLSPQRGSFLAVTILGDRAVKAALEAKLPKTLVKAIEQAPRYPEGTGLRFVVKNTRDLAGIRKLVPIKLAN